MIEYLCLSWWSSGHDVEMLTRRSLVRSQPWRLNFHGGEMLETNVLRYVSVR